MSSLEKLIIEARVTIAELSRLSEVSVPTIKHMLNGTPVRADKAGDVVDALSERLGRRISIEDAEIMIIPLR